MPDRSRESARRKIQRCSRKNRAIVTELAIQRQNLAKRLKVAEIAAQIKRLIELETNVLNGTTRAQKNSPDNEKTASPGRADSGSA